VEELGIPKLTTKKIELLCQIAEKAAKKYVLSKVSMKKISKLNIIVEAKGEKPITIEVDIDLELSPVKKSINPEILVKVAVKKALKASENYLRQLI
jgi:hypothetical protein